MFSYNIHTIQYMGEGGGTFAITLPHVEVEKMKFLITELSNTTRNICFLHEASLYFCYYGIT